MNIYCVSLTGADNNTDVARMALLSKKFPLLEWAILSSQKQAGNARYPTEDWVESFHDACPDVRKAVHLCGNDVNLFLEEDARIHAKVARFDRVQLNFSHRRKPIDVDQLVALSAKVPATIILQHNSANEPLWTLLKDRIPGISFLFDASGGNGKSPEQWPTILPDTFCGYAGGLGPDNLLAQLPLIDDASLGKRTWVDMESKLRNAQTGLFDLDICESIMDQVNSFQLRKVA